MPSLVGDEELEAFHRVEQFRELNFEAVVERQLLTESHGRRVRPESAGCRDIDIAPVRCTAPTYAFVQVDARVSFSAVRS